jgi:hypothetical protein
VAAYRGTPDDGRDFWQGLGLGLLLSAFLIAAAVGGIVALVTVLGPIVNLP